MSIDNAKQHLSRWQMDAKIMEFEVSSATVEQAAEAVGCAPERIAKTLSFDIKGTPILIVAAGDAKIDNQKYKSYFATKAKMLKFDQVHEAIGHQVGGVCPFGVNEGVKIYLDSSLKRFETVFPACGTSSSAIEMTIAELEATSEHEAWVDVCKALV